MIALSRYVCIFVVTGAVLWLALIAANLVPNAPIVEHISDSIPTYHGRPDTRVGLGSLDTRASSHAECVSATMGISDTPSPIVRSLESRTLGNCRARRDYIQEQSFGRNYWRYWHGYQIVSRPALAIVDLRLLRDLNAIVMVGAVIFFVFAGTARLGAHTAFAVLVATPLVPSLSQLSLFAFSPVWLIGLGLGIYLLLNRGKPAHRYSLSLSELFLIQGVLTAFFDLLTTPLVAFTIPMTVLCLLWLKEGLPVSVQLRQLAQCGAAWLIGYVAFWATKWGLSIWLVPDASLDEIFRQVSLRISDTHRARELGRFDGLGRVLWQTRDAMFVIAALAVAALAKGAKSVRLNDLGRYIPLALLVCAPASWMVAMLNHTLIHYFFVAPIMIPSFFIVALLSLQVLLPERTATAPL